MARTAWIDPNDNGRLHSHGYNLPGSPGMIALEVADVFLFNPFDGWRWDGRTWQPFPFPPPPKSELRLALEDAADDLEFSPKLRRILTAMKERER